MRAQINTFLNLNIMLNEYISFKLAYVISFILNLIIVKSVNGFYGI